MAMGGSESLLHLQVFIEEQLKPFVKQIDEEAFYPLPYLQSLGESGYLPSSRLPERQILFLSMRLIDETAKTCMTTAFNLWCHLAASTYIRKSDNTFLKSTVLPLLENGQLRGGTGLSNPMKYYAGLEKLCLKAKRIAGGYLISGRLPMVSNLGSNHWFALIASCGQNRMMAFVPCHADGLTLKEKIGYLGLNGSATYSCEFNDVFVPDEWVISEQADDFVVKIRPIFVLYQIPLGLGIVESSIRSIHKVRDKQNGCNQYLNDQPEHLESELKHLRERAYSFTEHADLSLNWKQLIQVRLDIAYLALKSVQASMLHHGAAGYLRNSDPSRRLREAYFFVNLTPTIKHLEKMIKMNE